MAERTRNEFTVVTAGPFGRRNTNVRTRLRTARSGVAERAASRDGQASRRDVLRWSATVDEMRSAPTYERTENPTNRTRTVDDGIIDPSTRGACSRSGSAAVAERADSPDDVRRLRM